jgi:hypothetical protein
MQESGPLVGAHNTLRERRGKGRGRDRIAKKEKDLCNTVYIGQ